MFYGKIYSQQLVNFLCLLCACKILLLTVLHPVHWLLPAYKNCTKAGLSICAGVLNIDAVYQAVCSLLHSHLQSLVRISSVDLCPQSSWSHITTPVADLTDTGTARHELSMVTGKSRGVMDSLKYVLRSSLCCILDGSPFHLQHARSWALQDCPEALGSEHLKAEYPKYKITDLWDDYGRSWLANFKLMCHRSVSICALTKGWITT